MWKRPKSRNRRRQARRRRDPVGLRARVRRRDARRAHVMSPARDPLGPIREMVRRRELDVLRTGPGARAAGWRERSRRIMSSNPIDSGKPHDPALDAAARTEVVRRHERATTEAVYAIPREHYAEVFAAEEVETEAFTAVWRAIDELAAIPATTLEGAVAKLRILQPELKRELSDHEGNIRDDVSEVERLALSTINDLLRLLDAGPRGS
jgi:hypothetical protein